MEDALAGISQSLQGVYAQTIARIENQSGSRSRLGMKALLWVFQAVRPLKLDELLDALAIRSEQNTLNPKYRPTKKLLLSCCMGLITIEEESSNVRLVHYTIQEYLQAAAETLYPDGEEQVAMACMKYLMTDNLREGPYARERHIRQCVESYPFVKYAATYWGFHFPVVAAEKCEDLALNLLSSQPRVAFVTQIHQYSRGFRRDYWDLAEVNSVTALHAACQQQSEGLVRKLLASNDIDINASTNIGTTALIRAASVGNLPVVEILLDRGADPTKTNWYGTALHCAAEGMSFPSFIYPLKSYVSTLIRERKC